MHIFLYLKKSISCTAAAFVLAAAALLASCSPSSDASNADGPWIRDGGYDLSGTESFYGTPSAMDSVSIVTTIFPMYDWVRELSDGVPSGSTELILIIDNGADMHSYQPTVDDIIAISESDVLIYVGGESDEWIEDVLANAPNPQRSIICLMDILGDGAKTEEITEGMQEEKERIYLGGTGSAEDEEEYDEHVWLSVRNASLFCGYIADALCTADSANTHIYKENLSSYLEELSELDKSIEDCVAAGSLDTLLFADRFPFRYLTDDYGLSYYAAFPGCSAESEASFETIIFLADKLAELSLPCVLTLEDSDKRLAGTILDCAGREDPGILELCSMQSISADDIKNGITYISIMEENREVLAAALLGGY